MADSFNEQTYGEARQAFRSSQYKKDAARVDEGALVRKQRDRIIKKRGRVLWNLRNHAENPFDNDTDAQVVTTNLNMEDFGEMMQTTAPTPGTAPAWLPNMWQTVHSDVNHRTIDWPGLAYELGVGTFDSNIYNEPLFKVNSLLSPAYPYTNMPTLTVQMASVYQRYTVIQATINVDVILKTTSSDTIGDLSLYGVCYNGTPMPSLASEDAIYNHSNIVVERKSVNHKKGTRYHLAMVVPIGDYWDREHDPSIDDGIVGVHPGDPAEIINFGIGISCHSDCGGGANLIGLINARIDYLVQWSDPKTIDLS